MTFRDCDKVLPPRIFVSLKDDGDMVTLVFLGEPVPREEQFRKTVRHRYYFPVITIDGLQVWGVGSVLYITLRDKWADYHRKGFVVTRHGAADSTSTTYDLKPAKIPVPLRTLMHSTTPKEVHALLTQVQEFGVAGTE